MRPATIVQGINQAQEGATRFFFVCTAAMETSGSSNTSSLGCVRRAARFFLVCTATMEISGGSSNTSFLGCLRRAAAAIENYEQIFSSC
jgi:hypothetical protein